MQSSHLTIIFLFLFSILLLAILPANYIFSARVNMEPLYMTRKSFEFEWVKEGAAEMIKVSEVSVKKKVSGLLSKRGARWLASTFKSMVDHARRDEKVLSSCVMKDVGCRYWVELKSNNNGLFVELHAPSTPVYSSNIILKVLEEWKAGGFGWLAFGQKWIGEAEKTERGMQLLSPKRAEFNTEGKGGGPLNVLISVIGDYARPGGE